MNFVDWMQRVVFRPPERLDGLHLIFVDHAEQPHFAVDPAWPPRAQLVESPRHIPSHHPSIAELAEEQQRLLDEEQKRRVELLRKQHERRKREEQKAREDRELKQQLWLARRNREELKRLVESLEAEDAQRARAEKRKRRRRGWDVRRGVFSVRCPVCHAARFQKCTGTFHRAAHPERFALAWPDRDS